MGMRVVPEFELRLRLRGASSSASRARVRYRVTEEGLRTALCCHRTYARVLRPALSVVFDDCGANSTPLQNAVERLDREINRLWEGYSIAP